MLLRHRRKREEDSLMASQAMEAIGCQRFDRVRRHTATGVNARMDRQFAERIEFYRTQPREVISRRIDALEREWDIERILELNASLLAFTGLTLGLVKHKAWFVLPGLVLPFLLQHATQGWCPPVAMLRRLGVRTQREIDAEKYALKVLRGDFNSIVKADSSRLPEPVTSGIRL